MAKTSTSGQGRPKGTPNKITRTIREAFEHAFKILQDDNKAKLEVWGQANPSLFYQLAARLIPTEINANVTTQVADKLRDARKRTGL